MARAKERMERIDATQSQDISWDWLTKSETKVQAHG